MSAPAVAVSGDGKGFAAAWKDVREGSPRVWWAAAKAPKFGAERPVGDAKDVERDHPSIAVDDRGAFWIAWEDGARGDRRIRARAVTPGPSKAPSPTGPSAKDAPPNEPAADDAVRDVTETSEGAPAFPVIACGAGLVVVAWETSGPPAGERVFLRVLEDAPR